jgi:polyisoprenoid-binding protein YceI
VIGTKLQFKEAVVKRSGILAIIMILAMGGAAFAQTKTFFCNDEKKRDVVTFTSKAPLETIVGTTSEIIGMIETNPNDINSTKARFEVDLASLKTGISMRDGHMRDQFLETSKYPKAIFELTKVVKASQATLEDEKTIDITAEGNFTVHGVTKQVTIPLKITYFKESDATKVKTLGDLVKIEANWNLALSDYNITRPQFLILKLDDLLKIEISAVTSTANPPVNFVSTESK